MAGWQDGAPVNAGAGASGGWQSGAPVNPGVQPGGSERATAPLPTPADMQTFLRGGFDHGQTPPQAPPKKSSLLEQYGGGLSETIRPYLDAMTPTGIVNMALGTHLPTELDLAYMAGSGGKPVPVAPAPSNLGESVARTLGQNTINVLAPGGMVQKAASVILPTVGQEGAQRAAAAVGLGPRGQAVARTVGGVVGGVAAGAFTPRRPPPVLNPVDTAASKAVYAAMAVDGATPDTIQAGLDQGRLSVATTPGMAQLGETVTTLPGPGQVAIRNAAAARMATQTDRAMQAMQSHLGVDPENARGNIDAMVEAGQAKAAPIYQQITQNPAPVWNSQLQELAQRPAIKKAIGVVTNDMLNAGQNPTAAGFRLDPDTGWQIGPSKAGALDNIEQQPTAATWDAVYKAMGRTVERHPMTNAPLPDSVSAGNRGITTATSDLRRALVGDPANGVQGAIPRYGEALATSGDYLSTSGAFNRARGKLLSGPVYDFQKMWESAKTPAEQDAIRSAVANDVLEASDRGRIEPGLFRSPGVQKKLGIAFGDRADSFVNQMENDLAERNVYSRITGGPQTASRIALIKKFQEQSKPAGVAGMAGKVLGAAEWVQSMAHPGLLMTKLAHAGVDAAGKGGKAPPLPWENPEVSARLGGILSDPNEMRGLLSGMSADEAASAAHAVAARRGILTAPALPAAAALNALSGPAQGAASSKRAKR